MIYVYHCTNKTCQDVFEVIKSVKDIDINEFCPTCDHPAEREFMPRNIQLSKTKVTHPEYNPGLGTVVKNEHHKKDICKRLGVVEVGNDYGSGHKHQKEFDKSRKEKLAKRYDDV